MTGPTGAPSILKTLFSVSAADPSDKAATRKLVSAGATLTASFFIMNAAATLIAGYGLLANSVAVVIGAMLIAMLYGPILAVGLALAEADMHLFGRAVAAEILGALWVLSIGVCLGIVHQDIPIGSQILDRTAPNLLDLMIALVGGAAGAYASISPRVSSAVVGVAIATALCPPLAASGILLAHAQTGLSAGAFLLFLTNLVAIAVGAMLTFAAFGHRAAFSRDSASIRWTARLASLAALAVLAIYLGHSLQRVVNENVLRNRAEAALTEAIAEFPGARIAEVRLRRAGAATSAYAVIRTPSPLHQEDVRALDEALDRAAGQDLDLHVRVIRVEEWTRSGPVHGARWPNER
ncbi:MAG: DUF389 domain-containing protein [Acetobacteraceae bacterium]|nr:DUF389 domain-containing protein [Acetobacteraceae bacterium]